MDGWRGLHAIANANTGKLPGGDAGAVPDGNREKWIKTENQNIQATGDSRAGHFGEGNPIPRSSPAA